MEMHKSPVCGNAKTKKSKAVGAFRVFLNFLQKPNKKRPHQSQQILSENLQTIKCQRKDRQTSFPAREDDLPPIIIRSKPWSSTASGSVTENRSSDKPEVSNIDDVIVPRAIDDRMENEHDDDASNVDDDVFLNGSYFEDDYTEDYSGSSSDYNPDYYRCCDVPEPIYDDAGDDDDLYRFCSYNLDIVNTVDKVHDKIIPECASLDKFPRQYGTPGCHRRYSMPFDLPQTSLKDSNEFTTPTDLISNIDTKRFHSNTVTDLSADTEVKTPSMQESNDGTPKYTESSVNRILPMSKFNSCCPAQSVNTFSGFDACPTEEKTRGPVLDLKNITNDMDNPKCLSSKFSSLNKSETSQFQDNLDTMLNNKPEQVKNSNDFIEKTFSFKINPSIVIQSKQFSSEAKAEMDRNGRHSSDGSIESGYITSRTSSSSTPLSPVLTNDACATPLSEINTTTPIKCVNQRLKLTKCKSTSSKPNHVTPLHKLLKGNPISPHSRNAIDGIQDNKAKHRTARKTLKLKRMFHPTNPTDASSSELNLKPVPEFNESISVRDEKIDLDPGHLNRETESIHVNTKTVTEETTIETLAGMSHPGLKKDKSSVNLMKSTPIDINLNISVSIVDLNHSAHSDLINENQQTNGPLSCFPPSPEKKNRTSTIELPQTPPIDSRTPICSATTMADYLNEFVVTSPFGKNLRPICTSSPLPNKFAPKSRRPTTVANTPNQPATFDSSLFLPVQVDCSKSLSPSFCARTPNNARGKNTRNKTHRLNSDKRKKLVKRKSVRARLNFDAKDLNSELNESDIKFRANPTISPCQHSISGDYVLLKRAAESVVRHCPNQDLIHAWVDVPALMENMNREYSKIIKCNYFNSKRIQSISNLKENIISSRDDLTHLTIENCLERVFMSLLVPDLEITSASLDFVFENLPRVLQKHCHLSHLAPEVVMLLLCNQRTIVRNNHGFPLPYSQSEKEVFKAVVKYVECVQKGQRNPSVIIRVKNLLSIVADANVLKNGVSTSTDKRLFKKSQLCDDSSFVSQPDTNSSRVISRKPSAPRPIHRMVFTRSTTPPGSRPNQEYFFQPFISSNIHSLDELGIQESTGREIDSAVSLTAISDDSYVLRKLYFSYRRCITTKDPFITNIGMQYSHKGTKKTVFIAQSVLKNTPIQCTGTKPGKSHQDVSGKLKSKSPISRVSNGRDQDLRGTEVHDCNGPAAVEGTTHPSMQDVVKKAAVILKPGEHITGLSVLGQRALHNIEIVTNTGRRIRVHSIHVLPSDARWITTATPNGNAPFCLHALFGDLHKSASGRSYIRDTGALWMSTTLGATNDLG